MYQQIFNLLIILLTLLSKPAFSTDRNANVEFNVNKGVLAYQNGDTDQAIKWLENAPDHITAQLTLARLYSEVDLDKAEFWIERAMDNTGNHIAKQAEAHYVMGIVRGYQAQNAIFSKLSLAKKSKTAFETAVQLDPESVEYALGLMRYHLSAPSIAGGSLDEAKRLAHRIKQIDPLQGMLAAIDIAQEDDDTQAIESLIKEGTSEFGYSAKFNHIAGMFFQQQEAFDQAFYHFDLAQKDIRPESEVSVYSAAYQYGRKAVFSASNIEQGISALRHYINHAPVNNRLVSKSWAQFRLAMLLELAGNTKEANTLYLSLRDTQDKALKKQVNKKI